MDVLEQQSSCRFNMWPVSPDTGFFIKYMLYKRYLCFW